ncbi:hypothetical protein R3P38DRAFT_1848956 [Favolaschia claudopus]|uniref:Fungal-type protein kinase domain-containing protein n=1 Tax=Favolaschia claudopus TaxID=2862362 RepID=A0AAW0D5W4_9AGAR
MEETFIQLVPAKQLVDMLPSSTGEAKFISTLTAKCRAWYKAADKELKAAQSEDESRKPLIAYLDKIFKEFSVESGSSVADASNTRPATSIDDIKTGWLHAGLVVEFELQTDIFDEDGRLRDCPVAVEDVKKLEKRALSLLAIHGRCHVYVVAVFNGRMTRILRFDRGGFIATDAFNWLANKKLIPTFFYRLYNAKPGRMYGDDDTISVPSAEVKQKIFNRLQETEHYRAALPTREVATKGSLRIKAVLFYPHTNPGGQVTRKGRVVNCLSFGTPLAAADGLFGRATNVYRVILEEELDNTEQPLAFYALKDSWREACRRPELDFYDAIEHHCLNAEPPVDMEGMARCRGSVDLADWDPAIHRTVFLKHARSERRHMRTLLTPVGAPLKNFKSKRALCQVLYTVVLHLETAYEAGVLHRDVSEGNVLLQEASPDKGFLLDWDYAEFTPVGLQKFRAAFKDRELEGESYRDIEKSLKDFTGTEPFMAIEILLAQQRLNAQPEDGDVNGVEGSDVAGAGDEDEDSQLDGSVAHEGIFVASEEADDKMKIAEGKHEDDLAEDSQVVEMNVSEGDNDQGHTTAGTTSGPRALEHGPHHDLESVYWLLVWMILRHTKHGHFDGALACANLFASTGFYMKHGWILRTQFRSKHPLFQLAEHLRDMVLGQYPAESRLKAKPILPEYITHKEVLSVFKKYLKLSWGAAVPMKQYKNHSVNQNKKVGAKASESLLKKAAEKSQGSTIQPTAASEFKAESTVVASFKRGRRDGEDPLLVGPVVTGSGSRPSKKVKVSEF